MFFVSRNGTPRDYCNRHSLPFRWITIVTYASLFAFSITPTHFQTEQRCRLRCTRIALSCLPVSFRTGSPVHDPTCESPRYGCRRARFSTCSAHSKLHRCTKRKHRAYRMCRSHPLRVIRFIKIRLLGRPENSPASVGRPRGSLWYVLLLWADLYTLQETDAVGTAAVQITRTRHVHVYAYVMHRMISRVHTMMTASERRPHCRPRARPRCELIEFYGRYHLPPAGGPRLPPRDLVRASIIVPRVIVRTSFCPDAHPK